MSRARRRAFEVRPGSLRSARSRSLHGADVAVTCRDRVRSATVDRQPAARLLPETGPAGETGRPAAVEVVVGADLIAARAAEIHSVVDRALLTSPRLLRLRLEEVQRFDAAGLGLLLRVRQQAQRQGVDLVCTGPPRQLLVALQRTRLRRLLTVLP